jgi:hypothetical protein
MTMTTEEVCLQMLIWACKTVIVWRNWTRCLNYLDILDSPISIETTPVKPEVHSPVRLTIDSPGHNVDSQVLKLEMLVLSKQTTCPD